MVDTHHQQDAHSRRASEWANLHRLMKTMNKDGKLIKHTGRAMFAEQKLASDTKRSHYVLRMQIEHYRPIRMAKDD